MVNILDRLPDEAEMTTEWRKRAVATLNRYEAAGVDRKAVDAELVRLLAVVNANLSRRRADRERTAARRLERERLRLVDPSQPDLFGQSAAPAESPTPHRDRSEFDVA